MATQRFSSRADALVVDLTGGKVNSAAAVRSAHVQHVALAMYT